MSFVSQATFFKTLRLWGWGWDTQFDCHYNDVIMSAVASQIIIVSIVYSTVCSGADQRKHQSPAPLAFVRGIHRWPVNSPHKGPVTHKMFPFDDVIVRSRQMVAIFQTTFSNTFSPMKMHEFRLTWRFHPSLFLSVALVQIMAWRWPGDKPLFEPMMFSLLTYIGVTLPQWVKYVIPIRIIGGGAYTIYKSYTVWLSTCTFLEISSMGY